MTIMRRVRGRLLRLVRRRAVVIPLGVLLVLPAAWIHLAGASVPAWFEGVSLVLGATGAAATSELETQPGGVNIAPGCSAGCCGGTVAAAVNGLLIGWLVATALVTSTAGNRCNVTVPPFDAG